jgi:hypothetical protein
MASIIKADTLQSTTSNVFVLNSAGTEYARFDSTGAATLSSSLAVTGVSTFAAGTAALPAITTTGDTNTGIFFSAADTIDFAEGGTATGQFDSSGNFKFNSGYGSVATAYACRAWVNFNGTSTVAINGSGNVTSITDNGTGDYTVNFTTAMPDADYAVASIIRPDAGSGRFDSTIIRGGTAPTTSAVRINTGISTYGVDNYNVDELIVCVSIFR